MKKKIVVWILVLILSLNVVIAGKLLQPPKDSYTGSTLSNSVFLSYDRRTIVSQLENNVIVEGWIKEDDIINYYVSTLTLESVQEGEELNLFITRKQFYGSINLQLYAFCVEARNDCLEIFLTSPEEGVMIELNGTEEYVESAYRQIWLKGKKELNYLMNLQDEVREYDNSYTELEKDLTIDLGGI